MSKSIKRTRSFMLRLTPGEYERLNRISRRYEETKSETVRRLVEMADVGDAESRARWKRVIDAAVSKATEIELALMSGIDVDAADIELVEAVRAVR